MIKQIKIPCENCLILPICKDIFRRNRDRYMRGVFIMQLTIKCSIVADLTNLKKKNESPNRRAIQKIIDFFQDEYTKSLIEGN